MKKSNALNWIVKNSKSITWKLVFTIVIGVAISILGVNLALYSKNVIDVATGVRSGNFMTESIKLFIILILQILFTAIESNVKVRLSGGLTVQLRQNIFERLLNKDWQKVSAHHSGELLNRINSDVQVIVTGVSNILPTVFSLASKLISAFWAMFLLDKTFAIIAVVVGPVVIVLARIYSKKMKMLHKKCQEADGKTSAIMQESLQNMLMIKSFGSEGFIAEKAGFLQRFAYKLKIKRNTIGILASSGLFFVFSAAYYAALAWGAYRLAAGVITIGTLTAFLQLVNQIQHPFMSISSVLPQYYSMVASAERVMELENLPDEIKKNENIGETDKFEKIGFNNVSFVYDNGEEVFNKACFEIHKNEFVAVTGESGAGKSTLIKLLLGIVTPEKGEVEIICDGRTYIADGITRKLFSYVPQGNMILSGTIRDNIKFSNENATDKEIEKCAKLADIWEFISQSERGLDTLLGERGVGLSEGQVQRLAIARALLYDAPILLLDEATSALDSDAERKVLQNIKSMTDKTCIIISHKRAALEFCDKSLKVANKEIK